MSSLLRGVPKSRSHLDLLESCSRLHSFGGSVIGGCGTWDTQSWLMAVTWLLTCLSHPLLTAEIKSDLPLISSCTFDLMEFSRRYPFFPRADPRLPHLPGAIQPITSLRGPSVVTAGLQVFSEHMSSGSLILKPSKRFFPAGCAIVLRCGDAQLCSGSQGLTFICGFPRIDPLCNEEVSKQSVPNPSLFLLTHRTLYSSKTGQGVLFLPQHPPKLWGDTEDATFELGV